MSIKIIAGDMLKAEEDILIQQVNAQGRMGAGLAGQIRKKYPKVYDEYILYCSRKDSSELMGDVQAIEVEKGRYIVNIFAQLKYGFDGKRYTSYDCLYNGLEHVKKEAVKKKLSVAIPYGIGCVLGGASWSVVYAMIEEIFKDYEVKIYKLD